MWSKKTTEINNPPMKKGQVMFVTDNLDGGYDEQYIKIATEDGHFNDFEYGIPGGANEPRVIPVMIKMLDEGIKLSVPVETIRELSKQGNLFIGYDAGITYLGHCQENSGNTFTITFTGMYAGIYDVENDRYKCGEMMPQIYQYTSWSKKWKYAEGYIPIDLENLNSYPDFDNITD